MSRPTKRSRQDVDCDGCNGANPECVGRCQPSPNMPSTIASGIQYHQPAYSGLPASSNYFPPQPYGGPPVPSLATPRAPVAPLAPLAPLAPHPDPANLGPSYGDMISQLDDNTVRLILTRLASVSPPAQAIISSSFQQQMRLVRELVINFDEYSRDAWHILNTSEYTEGSGSKQFEASFNARSDVVDCIEAIGRETHAESSYGTKLSALETLRKIAKTILLAGDTLGSEVRKEFQHESCLGDIMLRVAGSMTPEEQRRAGANTDAKGSLAAKLRWVCEQGEAYCLDGFSGLRDVLVLIGDPDNLDGQGATREQPKDYVAGRNPLGVWH
ncbi:hypothetical protein F5Y14DRAFT_359109 [Nemania sp. NC0429]|nr:hypothetical protein F5Y14DRAFT_359109 [Nemania sp. NC0429]